jgi:hypothetical protein
VFRLLIFIQQRIGFRFHTLQERVLRWTKPPTTSLLLDTLADLAGEKQEIASSVSMVAQVSAGLFTQRRFAHSRFF